MKLNRIASQLAASALLLVLPLGAYSAGLGRLTVNSALGQPLSAEIELLAVDKAELDSLNASLAAGQAFKDAQIEFAPVLSTLKFAVDRRQDGRPVLKITSTRPVNDPFLDMLIELNWASGRLVREYTVLLDPPGVATPQIVAPVMVTAPVAQAPKAATPSPEPKPEPLPAAKPLPVAKAAGKPDDKTAAEPQAAAAEKKPEQQPAPTGMAASASDQVRVKRGDTLAGIAMRVKPANISLDQALVSLYNENTQAFVGKNMNRLKAGKTLTVPSEDAMASVDAKAATREVRLQASDWQIYRTKLAERVASTAPAESAEKGGQISAGKITPKVEDKAQPAKEIKDVLKLSKSAVPPPAPTASAAGKAAKDDVAAKDKTAMQEKAKAEAEDLTAREKALKESADRVATLEKQIQDMQDLAQLNERAQQGAEKAPAPIPAPKIEAKPPLEAQQANWYQQILENPLYWGGGLAALGLGGALWWMMAGNRRRKSPTQQFEDSLMSSQGLSANTVIGAASGGAVNTGDTSFLTDFSQAGLGTIDTHDVDPIAEAEVYMAYGRDAQAEEILKEALNKTPDRHEVRVKLLEIYAARKNTAAFGAVAKELHDALGHSHSPIWERAAEMGRAVDPGNPLYGGAASRRTEGASVATDEAGAVVAGAMGVTASAAAAEAVTEMAQAPSMEAVEPAPATAFETAGEVLDFDQEIARQASPAAAAPEPAPAPQRVAAASESVEKATAATSKTDLDHGLEFDLSGLDIKLPEEDEGDFSMDEVDALSADGKMDFSGLDLNLEDMGGEGDMDEVATKLDLARAYLEMGDKEGAREILQEVLNEGNDKQQNDARSMMVGL